MKIIIHFFSLLAVLFALQAKAELPTYLGGFSDWKVFSFKENDQVGCYAISDPTSVEGSTDRTNSHIYISHRPALDNFNEVSFVIGHNLKPDAPLEILVDNQHFSLVLNGNKAWTRNANEDQKLVQTLLKGSKLTLKATLRSNKPLTQIYSLKGITAAHNMLNKKCPSQHIAPKEVK